MFDDFLAARRGHISERTIANYETVGTADELQLLINAVITDPRLDEARDLFLFGCFTGARYSDVSACHSSSSFRIGGSGCHVSATFTATKRASHMARKTFVTLSLERGMRPEVLMSFTGHRSFKTMKRYIAHTEKSRKEEMERVWG